MSNPTRILHIDRVTYTDELKARIYGEDDQSKVFTKKSDVFEIAKFIESFSTSIKDECSSHLEKMKEAEYKLFLIEINHPSLSKYQRKKEEKWKSILSDSKVFIKDRIETVLL